MQDETLLVIPFDSVCDFEMSVPFFEAEVPAHGLKTITDLRAKLVEYFMDEGYFDLEAVTHNTRPEIEQRRLSVEESMRFTGGVIVARGTVKDAHRLAYSIGYEGLGSDDGARDLRMETILHYCLLHAVRFIHERKNPGEYPSYAEEQRLNERSMTALPKMVLSQVEDAVDQAVERYDMLGFYDLDPADEARQEADGATQAADAIKPYARMVP